MQTPTAVDHPTPTGRVNGAPAPAGKTPGPAAPLAGPGPDPRPVSGIGDGGRSGPHPANWEITIYPDGRVVGDLAAARAAGVVGKVVAEVVATETATTYHFTTAPTGSLASTRDTLRLVAPLLLVNGLAVYGQGAYAYDHIAPGVWPVAARVILAVMVAAAAEAIALYVGWHAHDSLINKNYATAGHLRRASYLIAAVVAAVNYTHFANGGFRPTGAAVIFGLLSLVSPWLWGLHTRRAQHVQLVKEHLVDDAGAVFSPSRRRAFPVRAWRARRWSIDHNVRDPKAAWRGYNIERDARRAARRGMATTRGVAAPTTAVSQAPTARSQRAATPKKRTRRTVASIGTAKAATTPVANTTTTAPTEAPTAAKWKPVAIRDAAHLRALHGTLSDADLPGRNEIARQQNWNGPKATDARAAYLAGADLTPEGASK